MSKEAIDAVNTRLVEHFKEAGIENACYYQPVSEDYWANDHKKIAFCNLETYSTREDSDKIQGIVPVNEERLYMHLFFGKTTEKTFILNYALSRRLYENQETTEDTMLDLRDDIKENGELWHGKLCDDFNKSLYFNCRYTQSSTVNEDKWHTINAYRSDSFYAQHYKDFVKAAEIEVLVLGGRKVLEVVTHVYPELKGKLTFCGEPILYEGVLFVSMAHPAARKNMYLEMASVVNKIAKAMK